MILLTAGDISSLKYSSYSKKKCHTVCIDFNNIVVKCCSHIITLFCKQNC